MQDLPATRAVDDAFNPIAPAFTRIARYVRSREPQRRRSRAHAARAHRPRRAASRAAPRSIARRTASDEAVAAALREADDLIVAKPRDIAQAIVESLVAGKVVGLYQGRSEFGPARARSSQHPGRSAYRRDARLDQREGEEARIVPTARADRAARGGAARHFDIRRPSPFMQFAAPVRPEMACVIPAVTHVDCTAPADGRSR